MQITFFSNFLNHHQVPFCDEMFKQIGRDFTFVSTEKVPDERLRIGYQDYTGVAYHLAAYDNQAGYNKALQLGVNSDIVIIGAAPENFVKERLRRNKHTFRYAERHLKKGTCRLLDPRVLFSLLRNHTRYRRKNLYMLCASAYTANDLRWVFAYPGKKYKWGYFPEVEELDIDHVIANKSSEPLKMIWVGRFLDWKHPELVIRLALKLKQKGYHFHLNMIGAGEMAGSIQEMIKKLDVADCISLLGGIANSEVIWHMRYSNIFLFTSDRNEGWGAVLNEAMSNGCAVVASHAIGSVPFLIKHRENGLVFRSGSRTDLLHQTESLIANKTFRETLGRNAYHSVKNEWSPEKAASNFLTLAEGMLLSKMQHISSGPCSIAAYTKKNYWKSDSSVSEKGIL